MGYAEVDGCQLTFWNEYATAEKDGKRLATFPDLIMTINAKTGEPVTTAMDGRRTGGLCDRGR